jgi:stage II sporulation protein R
MKQIDNDKSYNPDNSSANNFKSLYKDPTDKAIDNLLKYIRNEKPHYIKEQKKLNLKTLTKRCNLSPTVLPHTKDQENGQFKLLLLILILLFSGITMWLVKTNTRSDDALQTGIAEDIIRFHVIANSDSEEDQALKLTVKSTLVDSLSPYLKNTDTKSQAREILTDKLSFIEGLAEETIRQNGYNYPVTVSLTNCYFPLKIYGDYTFPPGTYEALRVQIGEAKGKNWWCVMYPPLCFVDETYSIVDDNSKEQLKHLLTEEEYDSLVSKKPPVKIKFKLIEKLKDILS